VTFSSRFNVFESHLQEPLTLKKIKFAMDSLAQNLGVKDHKLFFFKIKLLKLTLKDIFELKIIKTYKLIRFNLIAKFCQYQMQRPEHLEINTKKRQLDL